MPVETVLSIVNDILQVFVRCFVESLAVPVKWSGVERPEKNIVCANKKT